VAGEPNNSSSPNTATFNALPAIPSLKSSLQKLHQNDRQLKRHLERLREKTRLFEREEGDLERVENELLKGVAQGTHKQHHDRQNGKHNVKKSANKGKHRTRGIASPRAAGGRSNRTPRGNVTNTRNSARRSREKSSSATSGGTPPTSSSPTYTSQKQRQSNVAPSASNAVRSRSPRPQHTPGRTPRHVASSKHDSPNRGAPSSPAYGASPPHEEPLITQVSLTQRDVPEEYYQAQLARRQREREQREKRKKQRRDMISPPGEDGLRLIQAMESLQLDLAQLSTNKTKKTAGTNEKSSTDHSAFKGNTSAFVENAHQLSSKSSPKRDKASLSARGPARTPSPHRSSSIARAASIRSSPSHASALVMQSARESASQMAKRREQMRSQHLTNDRREGEESQVTHDQTSSSASTSPQQITSYLQYLDELRKKDSLRLKAASLEMKQKKLEKQRRKVEELKKKENVKERLAALNQYTRSLFHIDTKDRYKPPPALNPSLNVNKPRQEKKVSRAAWLEIDQVKRIMRDPDEPRPPSRKKRKPPLPNVFREPSPKRVMRSGEKLSARCKDNRSFLKRKSRPVFHQDLVTNRQKTPKRSSSQKKKRPSSSPARKVQKSRQQTEPSHPPKEELRRQTRESDQKQSESSSRCEETQNRESAPKQQNSDSVENVSLYSKMRDQRKAATPPRSYVSYLEDNRKSSESQHRRVNSEEEFANEMNRISEEFISKDVEAILRNYAIIEDMDSDASDIEERESSPATQENARHSSPLVTHQKRESKRVPASTAVSEKERSPREKRDTAPSRDSESTKAQTGQDELLRNLEVIDTDISDITDDELDGADEDALAEILMNRIQNDPSLLGVEMSDDKDSPLTLSKNSSHSILGRKSTDESDDEHEPLHAELDEDEELYNESHRESRESKTWDGESTEDALSFSTSTTRTSVTAQEKVMAESSTTTAFKKQHSEPSPQKKTSDESTELSGATKKLLDDLSISDTGSDLSEMDEDPNSCKTQ